MPRALHFLLLLGALIGLFGAESAYALGPRMAVAPAAVSGMDADCMEMMRKAPPSAPTPCKGMTLDCIAAMGCVVPVLVQDQAAAVAEPGMAMRQVFWPATSVLAGSDPPPEQHPPTQLG
ncbi:hypothetical protein OF829_11725 [Sphingomonas sp. LB-2]|uniref:hypothetical protein n=1 Tax=Sphingomonas caeni TaxID=2984949 RepID=UPI0022318BBC|nr:hypothetical protein [Sphingomonas caeni]MCW3847910.1 hypothetical protein [Sphingomonas caeni]